MCCEQWHGADGSAQGVLRNNLFSYRLTCSSRHVQNAAVMRTDGGYGSEPDRSGVRGDVVGRVRGVEGAAAGGARPRSQTRRAMVTAAATASRGAAASRAFRRAWSCERCRQRAAFVRCTLARRAFWPANDGVPGAKRASWFALRDHMCYERVRAVHKPRGLSSVDERAGSIQPDPKCRVCRFECDRVDMFHTRFAHLQSLWQRA